MLPVRTVATDVKAKCKCDESVLGCEFIFLDKSLCFWMRVYILGLSLCFGVRVCHASSFAFTFTICCNFVMSV